MDHSAPSALQHAYDVVADSYVELLPDSSFEAALDLAMVNHFVALLRGRHVLDAGCGGGRMMTYLMSVDSTLEIEGIDLSGEMVRHARLANPTCRVVRGDLSSLPHADGVFDGVLAWYSVIHTPLDQLDQQCAEIKRVLRPGGVVLVSFQTGDGHRDINRAYGHDVAMSAYLNHTSDIEERLLRAGFDSVARLDRTARPTDRHPQGFVIAAVPIHAHGADTTADRPRPQA